MRFAEEWNGWSDPECLLQLSGYLRGKALQELLLLVPLGKKFNSGNRTLAVQDFWHATQALDETVSDYIFHLEMTFRQVYGQNNMDIETQNIPLYSQLQEGLRYAL